MSAFRKLTPLDGNQIEAHLLRLNPEQRRLRFTGQVSDQGISEHCRRYDWLRDCAIGCFIAGELRGVAEVCFANGCPPPLAELAITVESGWQNQGIGTELLRQAVLVGRNRFVQKLVLTCLLENGPMRHIASKFGAEIQAAHGSADARIMAPFPTPLSLWEESTIHGIGFWKGAMDALIANGNWPTGASRTAVLPESGAG